MADPGSVTWRWLVGILMSVVMLGGGTWMTTMYAEVGRVKEEAKQDRAALNGVDKKVGVIEERTKRTEQDIQDVKEQQREQSKKLDELLRRTPSR